MQCSPAALTICTAFLLSACAGGGEAASDDPTPGTAAITADGILAHTRILASDAFEGRGPGTRGEDSTVAYLESQFRAMGLAPGNPDGTYIQNVGIIGFTSTSSGNLTVAGKRIDLRHPDDLVAVSRHDKPQIDVAGSDIVFVGYGIVAPEYGWDDYKGVDVRGKTLLMLVNDPPIPSSGDSTRLDDAIFKGRAMTYYGRWTYKYEIASEKGAAAAIIIHETGPAGYPYDVVRNGGERMDIDPPDPERVSIEAWMTLDKSKEVLAAAGHDFDALKRQAMTRDFRPVSLGGTATLTVRNTVRRIQSRNVVARLEGSDSTLRNEYVVYTAHWDHFGRDSSLTGDQIYNGALDNASGTAALLEMAEGFTRLPVRPKRSVLFLAVTAEERGLIGAKFYAQNPLYPLERTVANINIDGVNQWGRTNDIVIVGMGHSTMDDEFTAVVQAKGRRIVPDPEPEKGFFFRSDQFELAKMGVPVLYTDAGVDFIGRDSTYGHTKREDYTAKDYHQVTDEVKPDWDLSGGEEDARLLFEVGYRVAQKADWPAWKPGAEFKARRDAMLEAARNTDAAPARSVPKP
jgi:Zn-dependent M28 family amino/carboxypeptidase